MLKLQLKDKPQQPISIAGATLTIGQDESNDLVLEGAGISDFHAEIRAEGDDLYLVDLLSSKGTYVNDQPVSKPRKLNPWDVIKITSVELEVIDPAKRRPSDWALKAELELLSGQFFPIPGTLLVGREQDCDLIIDDKLLSRHHARLRLEDGALTVEDLGSANGTFVNGQRIEHCLLQAGDEIRFDSAAFRVIGPEVSTQQDDNKTQLRQVLDPDATIIQPPSAATAATAAGAVAAQASTAPAASELAAGHTQGDDGAPRRADPVDKPVPDVSEQPQLKPAGNTNDGDPDDGKILDGRQAAPGASADSGTTALPDNDDITADFSLQASPVTTTPAGPQAPDSDDITADLDMAKASPVTTTPADTQAPDSDDITADLDMAKASPATAPPNAADEATSIFSVDGESEAAATELMLANPAWLVGESAPIENDRYALKSARCHIGRSHGNDIQLLERSVSGRHAEIYQHHGDWSIKDMDSKNGTYLNDRRVTDSPLKDGDLLRMGRVELRFASSVEGLDGKPTDTPVATSPAATGRVPGWALGVIVLLLALVALLLYLMRS